MPTIRQSSLVDRSRMQPAEPPQSAMHQLPTQPVVAPAPDNTLVVSPSCKDLCRRRPQARMFTRASFIGAPEGHGNAVSCR